MSMSNITTAQTDMSKNRSLLTFRIDRYDPLARLIYDKLGWDWPQVVIVALLVYGPLEKFVIPALGGYLNLGVDIRLWSPDVIGLFTGFVVYPLILGFYVWTNRGIGALFLSLDDNQCFSDAVRYRAFLDRAQDDFNRSRWSVVSLAIAVLVVLLANFVLWGPTSEFQVWFGQNNTLHRIFALMLIGIVGYASGQIIVRQTLAITYLLRLLKEMGDQLVVHPYHVDGAGGLGGIGQYAVRFTFLILIVMLYFVGGALLPSLQTGAKLVPSLRNPALIIAWGFYIAIVPSTFIALLLPAHSSMTAARNWRLKIVIDQLEERLTAANVGAFTHQVGLTDALKDVEHLKSMRTLILDDYPTWPVSTEIRRQITASTLIPPAANLIVALVLNILSS
jgi:hypothetical protein